MNKTLKHPMNITWTRSTTKKTGVIAGCLLALALAGCGTTAAAATPSTSSAAPAPTVTQTVAPAPVPTRTVIVQSAPVQTVYQPAQGSSALTSCGSGVYAGSNTSCPFALNVQQAWSASGVTDGTVYAYSPATGQSYAMSCTEAGAGSIECSGGNNAYVQF